jgi:hypothetical protein
VAQKVSTKLQDLEAERQRLKAKPTNKKKMLLAGCSSEVLHSTSLYIVQRYTTLTTAALRCGAAPSDLD